MKIQYYGHACFLLEMGKFSVCIDPFGDIGLKEPTIKADYYFCSHEHYDHNNVKIVEGAKQLNSNVNYEIVQSFHDKQNGKLRGKNNILVLKEELVVAHLGDLGEIPNIETLSKLKNVDILLCPIGGKYTINYLEAIELINIIKPKIVIPMHYKIEGSLVDIDTKENFIKNVGLGIKYNADKIDIKVEDIKTNSTTIYILEV